MTGWDITPGGVDAVLGKVSVAADGMNEGIALYGTSIEGAAASAGTLSMDGSASAAPTQLGSPGGGGGGEGQSGVGLVAAALAEFAAKSKTDVLLLMARPKATIEGTVDATVAYANGQLEQAWNAQRQAVLGPDVNDLPGVHAKGR